MGILAVDVMKKNIEESKKNAKLAEAVNNKECKDIKCHIHGSLKARGRTFEGKVVRKLDKRVAIEFERMIYIRKYERYARKKTRIHARLPLCMEKSVNIGDLIKVQECRPVSKIIHFVVIKKLKDEMEVVGK